MRVAILAAAGLLAAGSASAASRDVKYGPAPDWVAPPPLTTTTPATAGAPLRVDHADVQTRLGPDADETYTAYRIKILSPQGLGIGNISGSWSPDSDDLTIHRLRIIRGGATIDVLRDTRFQIVRTENELELAMLNGQLTANVQTPGLQVGDELEFAATLRRRDAALGGRSTGFLQLPGQGALGAYRARLVWPDGKAVAWRASEDLKGATPVVRGGQHELTYELRDPKSVVVADGAPPRVNLRRVVQYSSFAAWSDVSDVMAPLFEKAAVLPPDSPVRAEAARIAKLSPDPLVRAEAALQLVQDSVRYVYVGLEGGNYRPATADETWNRRFGDCKAKTVLLLALLRELGVPAEAMLVNLEGGDGTDERLPTPAAFNHVVVRTAIRGRMYWLDGTRGGDRTLASAPQPPFRWALPLRPGATDLERVEPQAPELPGLVYMLEQDVSAGFSGAAKVRATQVHRGDEAWQMQAQLAALSPEDADRGLKGYWRGETEGVEPATVAWSYDKAQKILVLNMEGEGKVDWGGDDNEGRHLDIAGAGFYKPNELKRPAEQDQAAPWLVEDFPRYRCWITTIRLPPTKGRWRWDFSASHVDRRVGGVAYYRAAGLDGGVMRTVMSRRTLQPEITAEEARQANAQLEDFDHYISRVYQTTAATADARPRTRLGELDGADWSKSADPCRGVAGVARPAGR